VPLVAGIGEPVDDSCLHGDFSPGRQREFSLEVLSRWGMDDQAWRLDDTVHPFAMGMSESDIRLTTRFDRDNLGGLLSCLHEFGHGIYERQVDARYLRTPLQEGTSSGFHESQSRLWRERRGAWPLDVALLLPATPGDVPEQLGAVPLDEFHRALSRVAPGPIRVDADEVTYSLHIVLRFELEREMLAGTVTPSDLPDAFDAKLREYLGIEPANVLEGVLQDVHWSDSTSATSRRTRLGNVISIQLWERATGELGDLDDEFERGEFGSLREWLREHVHHCRVFERRSCSSVSWANALDAEPYLAISTGRSRL
jgi:carboxypeptidase Taq